MKESKSIDNYIATFPEEVQKDLQKIREVILNLIPNGAETISYGIPTIKLHGKNVVHFAAFNSHYSFFPTSSGVEAFRNDLKDYHISKGTIQFPKDKPIPLDLIKRITQFRVAQVENTN